MNENGTKLTHGDAENKNLLLQQSQPMISQPSHYYISTFSTDHLIIFSPFQ